MLPDVACSCPMLPRSKTQVEGQRPQENMYNILQSQLCRARQFNKFTAARSSRMFNWFSAQQTFLTHCQEKPEIELSQDGAFVSSVFRPSCSQLQLLLIKDEVNGIVTFAPVVVVSVFRGAVSKTKAAPRKLRVTKNLGINCPAEAAARLLVLFLERLPPAKEREP